MSGPDALDAPVNPDFGLRPEMGGPPPEPPQGDVVGAAFRQTNSLVSTMHYLANSGPFTPQPNYNPIDDIKAWKDPKYLLDHGEAFAGSQSPAESLSIKANIDQQDNDRRLLAANGKLGYLAMTMANLADPILFFPGGVAIDATRGITFTKAALEMGKVGLLSTTAQEALLQRTQQTRELSESAMNIASGTLLTALIGGGAASLLTRGERAALETQLWADRAAMNAHAGNPPSPEALPGLVAFHGSPHDFERFDLGKIGEGEGAQSYGYGLYFAENPRVAEIYKENLGGRGAFGKIQFSQGKYHIFDDFGSSIGPFDTKAEAEAAQQPGKLYQVRINADPDRFIDLNKPLSEQPKNVLDALKSVGADEDYLNRLRRFHGSNGYLAYKALENKLLERELGDSMDPSALPAALRNVARTLSEDFDIHGIKYLDKGSRESGDGTRNYVVFNDRHIEITHKNGEPLTQPEKHQALGMAIAAGAAATDTRDLRLVPFGLSEIPGVRRVVEKTSPMQRLFGADSPTARRSAADLAETALLFQQNLRSEVTTAGPALDREAIILMNQARVAVGDTLRRLFTEYRFGDDTSSIRRSMQTGFENWTGRTPEGKMSFDQFKEAVAEAGRNGDQHEIPQVAQAAQFIRNKVFEPWKQRAIDAGIPLGDVKTAESYVPRVYNKQAIAAKRPEFVERTTDWLASDQAEKVRAQVRIEGLKKKIDDSKTTMELATKQLAKAKDDDLFRAGFENDLIRAHANHDLARKQLEEEIANWEGKSTAEAKSDLKARAEAETARAEAIAAGTSKSKGERRASADKAVDRAVKRILESKRDLSRDDLRSRAQEITDRIIGSPDNRLPYELGNEHHTAFGGTGEALRGALTSREFNIPDATIKDFLENDIEHIVNMHLRTVIPDVLLTEKFGDTRMTEAFRKINDEYAAMVDAAKSKYADDAAKSEKESSRLEKERQGVISDLSSIRDRIRGTYGISPDMPLRNMARAVAVLKNYNVLTSLGSAALSSLPDMAGSVMRYGMQSTFRDAWLPFYKYLLGQSDVWKEYASQLRAMGIAVEMTLASRHHALNDILDTYHPQSRVERTMQWAAGKFQFVNLLAPWTDFAKINASMVAGSEILRAVKAGAAGKASARQMRTLGENGIEPHMYERISKAFDEGGEIRDGVHLPNTQDWTDAEARRVFEGAIAREADIAVVTPGQEKPLIMSHPILGILGQFKSFTAGATERILIANLQRRDAQVLQGMMFSMGLGMLSYWINSLTGGQPVSDNPADWIKEAASKANILGWAEEGNALASKMTRGGVDIYRLIGSDKPLSRFASRSAMDQLLGPTAGKIQNIFGATAAISRPSEWNEGDSKSIRRLVAGQNVFYIRRLFDQVEAGGNNAFGIPMKGQPENR